MKLLFALGATLVLLRLPLLADPKNVDCTKGQSLNAAVQHASAGDVITFTGICKESVVVSISGITLNGQNSAVIQSNPSTEALIVDGAQRVLLESFTVQNGSYGIHARDTSGVALQNVTAQNNALTGIFVEGNSTASISNSASSHNGIDGVDAENSSALIFLGTFAARANGVFGINLGAVSSAILAASTITAAQNTIGIQISLNSGMFLGDPGCAIHAENNATIGLTMVSGGHLFNFGGVITASGNGTDGIAIFARAGMDLDAASTVSSFGNQQNGLRLEELSEVDLFNTPAFSGVPGTTLLQVYGNGQSGILVLLNSMVHMFNQTQIQSHNNGGIGLDVDNGSSITLLASTIANNTQGDVILTFGSRAEITTSVIGKLACDATALIRGDTGKTCPAP